ncbi:helix-turn-helix domain-containing protein [Robertmurraya massiliosenegalensis]|uniref:helix-turn-helix domain-containing protein n=1 Tax=Robertmurraya massiliosenegalensis TaxID=1287657 RepID=UPI0002F58567|nr:RodZ domain-containing protein [Robertmurraya massiliosenegalensis]
MTELGNRLKEARLEKDMSLDDLQAVTKIQKRYLEGIEEGNYSMMPGPFYVRAFIKQYAEAVELEPEELFEQYQADVPASFKDDIPEKLSRVQNRKTISGGNSKFFDILPKILVFLFIIGALAVIWYFYPKDGGNEANDPVENNTGGSASYEEAENLTREPGEENPVEEDVTEEDPEETEVVEEEPVPEQEITVAESEGKKTTYQLQNAEQFVLKVVTTSESWVEIKNGAGQSFFKGMLSTKENATDNHTEDVSNEDEVVIRVGNSKNTEIYVNDALIEYVNTTDHVQDITIRFMKASE